MELSAWSFVQESEPPTGRSPTVYSSAQPFERTTRSTRLTWSGQVLLEDVRRIFAAIDQAKANVAAAAGGYHGTLRIAIS
jgi:hypothetical protein